MLIWRFILCFKKIAAAAFRRSSQLLQEEHGLVQSGALSYYRKTMGVQQFAVIERCVWKAQG